MMPYVFDNNSLPDYLDEIKNKGNTVDKLELQFVVVDKIKYPLVNLFYKKFYKKGIASKNESVFVLQHKQIVCCAKLLPFDTYSLLTGVACHEAYQRQGYATQLLTKVLALHTETIYCFSYRHLTPFYNKLGFTLVLATEETTPQRVRDKFAIYNKKNSLQLLVKNSQ